jgi:hypothetical protein
MEVEEADPEMPLQGGYGLQQGGKLLPAPVLSKGGGILADDV